MKNILVITAFFFTAALFSQNQGAIKGKIIDLASNGEPLLFANVQLKGSDISYETNFHGNFEISDLQPGTHTLVINHAGYESETITVLVEEKNTTEIAVDLAPMQISFDEIEGLDILFESEANLTKNSNQKQ